MNGPTPIMLVMFSAVAGSSPKRRGSGGRSGGTSGSLTAVAGGYFRPDARFPCSTVRKPFSPQPAMNTLKPCFMRCSTVCGSLAG